MKSIVPFLLINFLALALLAPGALSFVLPGKVRRPVVSSSGLSVSLSEADMKFDLESDPENPESDERLTGNVAHHKRANQIEIIKYNNRAQQPKRWCPFYFFQCQTQRSISNPRTKALHMDDELKRIESKFYRLEGEDLSQINFPLGYGLDNYNGNVVRPNVRVYELVTRAYSRAHIGQEGVDLAEDVVARYEKYYPSQKATTKMMTFVMKVCISAGNLERAEHWLNRIEKRYEITRRNEDLPGYYVYNPFIKGLNTMSGVSARTAAKRSMEVVKKIHLYSKFTEDQQLFPGRAIYIDIMSHQASGYRGYAAFERIQTVFRELQKNYHLSDEHPKLKPSIDAVAPVFVAASGCVFPRDDLVIKSANVLFDEYHRLYKETGDDAFQPNGTVCDALNLIYSKMRRKDLDLKEFAERTMILIERMAEYNVKFKDDRDKTSAFNRILLATESQIPRIPMSDPLKTRELFVTALDVFKKFHDESSSDNVPPNRATYQIFLRLCAKLPEGETRSKLSAKAFELCKQKKLVTIDTVSQLNEANPEYALSLVDSADDFGFDKGALDFLSMNIAKEDF